MNLIKFFSEMSRQLAHGKWPKVLTMNINVINWEIKAKSVISS